jgi:large subunit ribosomal protein L32e
MKELLKVRESMKRKKPRFIRQDFHKKRLRKRWVKPRGLHSKMKDNKRGHARKVRAGYGGPKEVRGTSKEGLQMILVHNIDQLQKVNKDIQGIIVSGKVGLKNRILLLKKAKEMGVKVINLDVDGYLKGKEELLKKRKEKKKKKQEKKTKKKEEKLEEKLDEKKADEKKGLSDKKEAKKESLSPAEAQKKEKDKLLTKREI